MGWHDWMGVVFLVGFVGPVLTLITICGISEVIQRKKTDANSQKNDSA